ncbi:aldehyde:ferredoxin oxidoreductase [Thermus oshimai JL-2]|uniref:Aldehyde:ferredoxin oxidoreductase n=1 Tax=Thermus oshimai JL-2 TaxID=751945 RepID=K7R082_THEOS|nr:aldehyde ferredoxin oxidoreductase family protein [Thermus oshimai]AFV76675.1 aldehyde:ferredoxin oxidoreductase [Thermus oshimai JL-2]
MPKGYHDRVAFADLSTGRIWYESYGEAFWRRYLGGRALAAYLLLKHVPPGADPLGPENALVFAPGVLTGAPISGSGRNTVAAKSPLTGGYGDAEGGGFFGAELKNAGLDALVVLGRAEGPVYLHVEDGEVRLHPAPHLWGKDPLEVEALIKEVHGLTTRVAQIGLGGENRVLTANVIHDLAHFAGRGGLGAVMGAKGLKAVSARAKPATRPAYHDPALLKTLARRMVEERMERAAGLVTMGTVGTVKPFNLRGVLPSHNFLDGHLEGAEALDGTSLDALGIRIGRDTCYACAIRCKQVVRIEGTGRYDVRPEYGGPEYEGLGALGSTCGVTDPYAVTKANTLCNQYGLDVIGVGVAIASAMEAVEKGYLDDEGLGLRFGNGDALIAAIEKLARREGRLGELLAQGAKRLAEAIGHPELAMHVKGQEVPMHDPRYKRALGVGYAVSPTGADHNHNLHDTAYAKEGRALKELRFYGEDFAPLPVEDLSEAKVRMLWTKTRERGFVNSLVLCDFVPWTPEEWQEAVYAATGWRLSPEEMLLVGERTLQLTRLFNLREGLGPEEDRLPERFFQPFRKGNPEARLEREAFQEALKAYRRLAGWEEGVDRGRLSALGLEEFQDALAH